MLLDSVKKSSLQLRGARVVLAALTLAVVAWIGYAYGRGQSLAQVARLVHHRVHHAMRQCPTCLPIFRIE